jgi:hypothetical protein
LLSMASAHRPFSSFLHPVPEYGPSQLSGECCQTD